jgi:hypothetical protein
VQITEASAPMKNIAFARLARAAMWCEEDRKDGYVMLVSIGRNGKVIHEALNELALNALLAEGRAKCDASQRLMDGNPNRLRPGVVEVTNKYWSVVR